MTQFKTVLVVEDNERHMSDAVKFLETAGIKVVKAVNATEALKIMVKKTEQNEYYGDIVGLACMIRNEHPAANLTEEVRKLLLPTVDAVITDLYMPLSTTAKFAHANDPTGLLVASGARALGVPVVICTAGNHHGAKYEWIHKMTLMEGFTMVDQYDAGEGEAPSKGWKYALEALQKLAAVKQ